ncbi:50S ribosomal protein L25 [Pontiella desulfatans]|uniref:Large ribosomal subunit protein bL25 n=1 Tax=Pontiella desulfatans TaxID=2750659 RepID=A0A6C2U644_PONDE|nr:50S ribosomal protein L25 [Pontiella desulfatans]VGO15319.1 50S ribosomal protein L25 [Pontiella desulfatans]
MEDTKLIAKKRDLEGSSNVRRMRNAGSLPAVIYGDDKESVSVELNMHEFEQVLHHSASESIIIDVEVEGEGVTSVLIKDVQHHPVTSDLMHVDLFRVTAGQVLAVDIQLELVGEAAGVKAGGTLDHVMHSIEVECLPKDLVEKIEIDVSEMGIGDALHVSDLQLGAKFKALVDEDAIVAAVAAPRVEEEEDEDGSAASEPEVITEKKDEE